MKQYAMGELADLIAFSSSFTSSIAHAPRRFTQEQFTHIKERLQRLKDLLDEGGLPVTSIWVGRAIDAMSACTPTDDAYLFHGQVAATLHAPLVQITNGLGTEMATKIYLSVPHDVSSWFDPSAPKFQQAVIDKFPDYLHDMFEAGNCYALGRSTAAVFHTQRLMEVGLKAFGAKLNADFRQDDNWGPVLGAIEKEIMKLVQKDPLTVKYRLIHSNLNSVRIAIRNRVMHPKDTYTQHEAMRAILATDAFLSELASVI